MRTNAAHQLSQTCCLLAQVNGHLLEPYNRRSVDQEYWTGVHSWVQLPDVRGVRRCLPVNLAFETDSCVGTLGSFAEPLFS